MKIEILDRVLIALDVVRADEREAIDAALRALAADEPEERARLKGLGRIPSGEIFSLPISPELHVILRQAGESPEHLQVMEIVRPEVVRSYFKSAA